MLLKQKFNPYPLVRYTERADTVAVHLYQGMIAIFVDTSPSVILAPATPFDHLQHFEEYRPNTFSRNLFAIFTILRGIIKCLLTPLYLLLSLYPNYIPSFLSFLFENPNLNLPIFGS